MRIVVLTHKEVIGIHTFEKKKNISYMTSVIFRISFIYLSTYEVFFTFHSNVGFWLCTMVLIIAVSQNKHAVHRSYICIFQAVLQNCLYRAYATCTFFSEELLYFFFTLHIEQIGVLLLNLAKSLLVFINYESILSHFSMWETICTKIVMDRLPKPLQLIFFFCNYSNPFICDLL